MRGIELEHVGLLHLSSGGHICSEHLSPDVCGANHSSAAILQTPGGDLRQATLSWPLQEGNNRNY